MLHLSTHFQWSFSSITQTLIPRDKEIWLIQKDSLFKPTLLSSLGIDSTKEIEMRMAMRIVDNCDGKKTLQKDESENGTNNMVKESDDIKSSTVELTNISIEHECLDTNEEKNYEEVKRDDDDSRITLSSTSSISLIDYVIDNQVGMTNGNMMTETQTCVICFESLANACFMECGHGGVCFECACVIAKKSPSHCPICRHDINEVFKLTRYIDLPIDNVQINDLNNEDDVEGKSDTTKTFIRLVLSENGVRVVHSDNQQDDMESV